MEHYFAVYGTLKRGYSNNTLLKDSEYLGTFQTEPNYTLFDGGFPIVEREGSTPITVELFKVTEPSVVDRVNALEGFTGEKGHPSNWYDVDHVTLPNGIVANMFVMDRGQSGRSNIVESGNWQRKY